jgi:hypothetical protein
MLSGAAGMVLATCLLRRSEGTFLEQLRNVRPLLADMLVGVATFLVLAGFIEGTFSQFNEPTLPYWLKIAVAALLFASFMAYLFIMPVQHRPRDEDEMVGENPQPAARFDWRGIFRRRQPESAS